MITRFDIDGLISFESSGNMLSVYIDTDPSVDNYSHKITLKNLLKGVILEKDVETAVAYFEYEHDWTGRSVAFFSSVEDDYKKVFTLAVPVRSRVRVAQRPYVKPLANILDNYGGYGIVLVDKHGARLLYFHLGEIRKEDQVVGEDFRKVKKGGGSQASGDRGGGYDQDLYGKEIAERNIRASAQEAVNFFGENNIRRILIGGSGENNTAFLQALPKSWQSLVVGSFNINMTATHREIEERALKEGRKAEIHKEIRLAKSMVTDSAKGRGVVLGLGRTLLSIFEGRVKTLVVREGYQAEGKKCKSCGFLTDDSEEKCGYCGGDFLSIPYVIEEAIRTVMSTGGDIEVLSKELEVEGFNDIGGVLRY